MISKDRKDTPRSSRGLPEEAAAKPVETALQTDAAIPASKYHATVEELEGVDRGLMAAQEGRFATEAEVEAVFLKHRDAR
jgi:hypothetical protein